MKIVYSQIKLQEFVNVQNLKMLNQLAKFNMETQV